MMVMWLPESSCTEWRNKFYMCLACLIHRKLCKTCEQRAWVYMKNPYPKYVSFAWSHLQSSTLSLWVKTKERQSKTIFLIKRFENTNYYFVTVVTPMSFGPGARLRLAQTFVLTFGLYSSLLVSTSCAQNPTTPSQDMIYGFSCFLCLVFNRLEEDLGFKLMSFVFVKE